MCCSEYRIHVIAVCSVNQSSSFSFNTHRFRLIYIGQLWKIPQVLLVLALGEKLGPLIYYIAFGHEVCLKFGNTWHSFFSILSLNRSIIYPNNYLPLHIWEQQNNYCLSSFFLGLKIHSYMGCLRFCILQLISNSNANPSSIK